MKKILTKLDTNVLFEINNSTGSFNIEIESTNNICLSYLKKIKNKKVRFIIKSALGEEKYFCNNNDKYKKRTIFSLKQTRQIIKAFERIDNKVAKEENELNKALIIYNYLAKRIKYEDKHCFNKNGDDIRRTLYSIISKKAVCSGFALILYEAFSRNNIKVFYVHSQNHLFNVLNLNNKFYPLDITWESVLKRQTKDNFLHYFANYPLFENTHQLITGENKFDYSFLDSISLCKKNTKLKTHNCKRNDNTNFYLSQLPLGNNLKFYAIYDKYYNIFDIISSCEDFDRVLCSNDKFLINCYKNSLLKGERIKDKIENCVSYVGYGEIIDGVFYKHNKYDYIEKLDKQKINNKIMFKYKGIVYTLVFKHNKFKLIREKLC